jgi:hypothetical protein
LVGSARRNGGLLSAGQHGGDHGRRHAERVGDACRAIGELPVFGVYRGLNLRQVRDGVAVIGERVRGPEDVPRIADGGDARAGIDGARSSSGQVGDLDLVLCGAEIYAEQSPQTCALSAVDQNFLHII